MKFALGDRVFYTENGPTDTGTVVEVTPGLIQPYSVRWDQKLYPNDPEVDSFAEHQLAPVEREEWHPDDPEASTEE